MPRGEPRPEVKMYQLTRAKSKQNQIQKNFLLLLPADLFGSQLTVQAL